MIEYCTSLLIMLQMLRTNVNDSCHISITEIHYNLYTLTAHWSFSLQYGMKNVQLKGKWSVPCVMDRYDHQSVVGVRYTGPMSGERGYPTMWPIQWPRYPTPPLNRKTDTCEKHYIPGPFLEGGKNIKTVIYFQFLLSKEIRVIMQALATDWLVLRCHRQAKDYKIKSHWC